MQRPSAGDDRKLTVKRENHYPIFLHHKTCSQTERKLTKTRLVMFSADVRIYIQTGGGGGGRRDCSVEASCRRRKYLRAAKVPLWAAEAALDDDDLHESARTSKFTRAKHENDHHFLARQPGRHDNCLHLSSCRPFVVWQDSGLWAPRRGHHVDRHEPNKVGTKSGGANKWR